MNEKTPKKELPGNLNKAELFALRRAKTKKEQEELMGNLNSAEKEMILRSLKNVKKRKKKKDIDRTEEYMDFKSGKKDEGYKVMEAAKGGMVKKYMGGGSVHKKKNKMLTTKGWGASRKT